jgi:DNA-binding CsgD family transcriptional regulator
MTEVQQLTIKERQVLGLLRQGHSDADIAANLYMSPRTVAKLIEHLLAKTGATSREHLLTRDV